MSDKDIVEEARELAKLIAEREPFVSPNTHRTEEVLRALADQVERLRGVDGELDDINECGKCDLCEDHHAR